MRAMFRGERRAKRREECIAEAKACRFENPARAYRLYREALKNVSPHNPTLKGKMNRMVKAQKHILAAHKNRIARERKEQRQKRTPPEGGVEMGIMA